MERTGRGLLLNAAAAVVFFAAVGTAVGAVEPEILANPDPILAQRYRDGAAEIDRLREIALDGSKPSEERLAALQELARNYPDAVLTPAAQLVTDADTAVALFAAKRLAATAVMSDHNVAHGNAESVPPFLRLMMWRHQVARDGLQRIIEDPRPEVRETAATSLATLSDPVALEKIKAGMASGIYTDTEIANYCGLADPDVGTACIQEVLDEGSPTAQATAVSYLGSNPSYQALVRDKYLFDAEAPLEVRTAAASVLGQYDSTFASYATTLTADPALPAELYTQVIEGYLTQSHGKVGPAEAEALKAAAERYSLSQPGGDFSEIMRRLDALIKP
jgi:hypothetical protein